MQNRLTRHTTLEVDPSVISQKLYFLLIFQHLEQNLPIEVLAELEEDRLAKLLINVEPQDLQ